MLPVGLGLSCSFVKCSWILFPIYIDGFPVSFELLSLWVIYPDRKLGLGPDQYGTPLSTLVDLVLHKRMFGRPLSTCALLFTLSYVLG